MAKNKIMFRGEISEMSAMGFIRALDEAPARSALDVYLYTPGGDVYAGGEMINALYAAISRGVKVSVEVGALCASMGASFMAAAKAHGCRVVAHANSEVMFHGCWTVAVGGADEMSDQAKAMYDFNATVIADLKRCGVQDCEAWFSADRQKWLNAGELLELGLVDEIIDAFADEEEGAHDVAARLAAMYTKKENTMEDTTIKDEEQTIAPAPVTEEAPAEAVAPVEESVTEEAQTEEKPVEQPAEEAPAPAVEDDIEKRVADLANKRFAGLQAKHEQMISNLKHELDDLKASLTSVTSERDQLAKDIEQRDVSLADLRDQLAVKSSELEQSEERLRNYVGNALQPESAPVAVSYEDAIKAAKTAQERLDLAIAEMSKKH